MHLIFSYQILPVFSYIYFNLFCSFSCVIKFWFTAILYLLLQDKFQPVDVMNFIGSRLESLDWTINWQDVFWASKCNYCPVFELPEWTIGRSCKWGPPSCSFADAGTERVSTSQYYDLLCFGLVLCFIFIFLIYLVNLVECNQI